MEKRFPFARAAAALFAAAVLPLSAADKEKDPPPVDQQRVNQAISKGAEFLKARLAEGLPAFEQEQEPIHAGQSYNEIVLYTLLHAGVPRNDASLLKLVQDTREKPLVHTYCTAIRAQAFEKFDPVRMNFDIVQCAQFLIDNQAQEGYWGYSKTVPLAPLPKVDLNPAKLVVSGPGGGTIDKPGAADRRTQVVNKRTVLQRRDWGPKNDNSNTQYALLGLAAAMAAGIFPPNETFQLVEKWLTDQQNDDGGWGYELRNTPMHGGEASYGSMTCGAVSTLSIILRNLHNNQSPAKDVRIQKGLAWLGKNLTFENNPGHQRWHFYWIYSVERAGSFAGTQWFGDRPWYTEGATWLLEKQNADGSWANGSAGQKILDTCWAILFLKQASKHYVTYSQDGRK